MTLLKYKEQMSVTKWVIKGIVPWKLMWVQNSINQELFFHCLGAEIFFSLKGHHPCDIQWNQFHI
jgi:hypothetical protein